ncbi:MAG: leucine-rich repeat protein [Mycoplasma sp.]
MKYIINKVLYFSKITKWIICASIVAIMLTSIGAGVGVYYALSNNQSFNDGELELKPDYNKKNTREEVIDLLVNSADQSINKQYLSAYIDLNQFPDDTNFNYLSDDVDYMNEELIFNFLADKTFGENNEVLNEFNEYTIPITITLPEITKLNTKTKYDSSLDKYEVLNNLTNDFSSTNEIIKNELMKYINLSQFPKNAKFEVIYNKQHFEQGQVEIGFGTDLYFDESNKIVKDFKPYSFNVDAAMSRATKITESSKYPDETKTLEEIKNFLLKDSKKSNEINVKNLSKYLIIDNINENTKFYLDNISLKSGFNGFVNVEISYNNYLDNAGNNVNRTRTFDFMVLTYVSHNASNMFRNRNKVNTRGYQSTLNFLKGDESGEISSTNDKTLNKESLSYWFTLRNIPSDATFTLESYAYAKGVGNATDKNNVEIEFSIDKYLDDDGKEVIVKEQKLLEQNKKSDEPSISPKKEQREKENNEDYRSICKGTIPIHIENTTTLETDVVTEELNVFDFKNSLLLSSNDNRMKYSKIRKYLVINDVPSNTEYRLDGITKTQSHDASRVTTNVAFNMNKWYENAEIKHGKKNLNFTIDVIKSTATNITPKTGYKKAITKESFEENLLKGSPGNRQINTNSEFFKQYFSLDTSNNPIVKLVDITDTSHATGGKLQVNFSLDNANDDDGMIIDNLKISCDIEYQDLFDFNQITGTIKGFQSDWINVTNELVIPSTLKNEPVTKIAANAFKDNKYITTIQLPDSIEEIGSNAFSGCTTVRMNKLEIHNNVTTVGNGLFLGMNNTQITSLSVPKHWDDAANGWISGFTGENYTVRDRKSLNLASNVSSTTHTKNIATDLTSSSSSTGEIKNLTRFKQYFTNEVYDSYPTDVVFNITNSTNIDKLNQRLTISANKYWDEQGRTKTSKISTVEISFDTSALYAMNSTKTEITGLVSGYSSRMEWNDGNIIIPDNITRIGDNAFNGIVELKTIDVIGTLTSIGNNAFNTCANFTGGFEDKLDLSKITSIGNNAFNGCTNLSSTFSLPILTSLGESAFKNASKLRLTNLKFLESFNSVNNSSFHGASSIDAELILTNTTSIGSNAFNGTTNIWTKEGGLILEKTTSIGSNAFNGTYKINASDAKYIQSISVRGIDNQEWGVKDLYTNHSLWSQGYWVEADQNVINSDDYNDGADYITLGNDHSAAIVDGVMYTWGGNEEGQLGIGSAPSQSKPVKVADNSGTIDGKEWVFKNSNITQITLGDFHSSAVDKNGVMYTWGYNYYGQLGIGTSGSSAYKSKPVKVADNSGTIDGKEWTFTNSNITQIALGKEHSSAVANGVIYTWGGNEEGQLGIGTSGSSAHKSKPVKVADNSGTIDGKEWKFTNSNITKIALGEEYSSVIAGGIMYTWGYNFYKQLGDGSNSSFQRKPVKVVDNSGTIDGKEWKFTNSNVTQIALGIHHSSAIVDGMIYTWGKNISGELGNGTSGSSAEQPKPVKVADNSGTIDGKEWKFTNSNVTQIALGDNHSSAITGGVMYTWGNNVNGQLGIGNDTDQSKPVKVHNNLLFTNSNITQVALGFYCSSAIAGGIACTWGNNYLGKLGDGTRNDRNTPVRVRSFPKTSTLDTPSQIINTTNNINNQTINNNSINKKQSKK